jgi:hypothetical protein
MLIKGSSTLQILQCKIFTSFCVFCWHDPHGAALSKEEKRARLFFPGKKALVALLHPSSSMVPTSWPDEDTGCSAWSQVPFSGCCLRQRAPTTMDRLSIYLRARSQGHGRGSACPPSLTSSRCIYR